MTATASPTFTPVKPNTRNAPQAKPHAHPSPSTDQIAQRAFEIYVKNGRRQGLAEQDWYQAEKELSEKDSCNKDQCNRCDNCKAASKK